MDGKIKKENYIGEPSELLEVTEGENMIGEMEAIDYQLITEATESNISSAFLDEIEVEGTQKKDITGFRHWRI